MHAPARTSFTELALYLGWFARSSIGGEEPRISGLSTSGTYNVEDICDGYMGDPSQATAETGEKILENWSDNLLELLRQYDEL